MPLISVIIPIYNTERLLPKCIESVLAQTLSDIEIILIDDGSTDESGKICDSYACKDKRIHVTHIPNHGVSHARNKGIELSQGKYIHFMDSDDRMESEMLSELYRLILRYHANMSTCGYLIEDENENIIYQIKEEQTYVLNNQNAISSLFHDSYYRYKGNLWDKLYDKKIIDKHQLAFNENIYYNEDRLFIFQYMMHCTSIACTTIPYYHYIIRNASAMHTFGKSYRAHMCTFMDAFDIMTTLSASFPESVRRTLSQDYIHSSISFFKKYATQMPMHEIQNRIRTIKRNQYTCLSVCEKIRYTLSFAHILVLKKFHSQPIQ